MAPAPALIRRMQDPRFAARAGNAAGIASFFALSAFGRRSSLLGRVMPALVVRRHVRRALGPFSAGGGRRKRLRVVAGTGAIAALAVGASRRRRPEA
jgi:hypothetical protein